MPDNKIKVLAVAALLLLAATPGEAAARVCPAANIPLTSYIYDDLEKLDGLGLIEDMRTGSRPYSRSRAAAWVRQAGAAATGRKLPPYAQKILDRLQREFEHELSENTPAPLGVREMAAEAFYGEKAAPLPFVAYNGGNKYSPQANGILSGRLEGRLAGNLLLSLSPRLAVTGDSAAASMNAAYAKIGLGQVEVEVGKDSLWWGQGFRGSLLLTNSAPPLNLAVIRWKDTTFFYSVLENGRTDVPYPSFAGIRSDFKPAQNFTWGAAVASMIGGRGHMLGGRDYWRLVSGENDSIEADKWNTIAGVDFRWRLPKLGGLQLYGEFYGEDQAHVLKVIPVPSELAELAGVYIPRLSKNGDWDARLEWAQTRPVWYGHALYTRGYTYHGDILGDAMGGDARRCSAQITHYTAGGAQYSLNIEQVIRGRSSPQAQRDNSAWLTVRVPCRNDCFLQLSGGLTRTANLDRQAGKNITNRFLQLTFTRLWP